MHFISYRVLPVLMIATLLAGCQSISKTSYVTDYQSAVAEDNGLANSGRIKVNSPAFENFKTLFSNLKSDDLESMIANTYADEFYFNDTFHTFRTRDKLTQYLLKTAENLEISEIYFDEVAQSDSSYFLSWTMYLEFTAKGKQVKAKSIGVSQIRFNDQGKVIFHQDFWDNTEGFFSHLPLLGYMLNKVRAQL